MVVAIITGRLGALIGRRRDGTPPWTFPSGRPVKATAVNGRRIRSRTGVLITYVAAVPADGADAVAAGEKLGKVRWVNRQKPET